MANSETISSLLVELGLDSSNFDKGLKNINKSTKLLEQNFNGAKKSLNVVEKDFDSLSKVISSGEDTIKAYSKKIDALGDTYKEQESKLKSFTQRQKELPSIISQAETELKKIENTLGKSSKEYEKQEDALKTLKQEYKGMDDTLAKTVNSMQSLKNQIQQTETKMAQAENEVESFRNELKQLDNVDLNIEGIDVLDAFEDIDLSDFTGQIDGLDKGLDLLSLGAKGAGLALTGMITASAINSAKEYDKTIFDLRTGLGQTKKEAEQTSKSLSEITTEGYDADNLTNAYSSLSKVFKDMNEKDLQSLSKNFTILNDMGFETDEIVQALAKSTKAWGISNEEAIGLIIKANQEGLNMSGDLLETLAEYSPVLADMGIGATDFFNMMVQGFDQTKASSDHLADAFKEVLLRFTEGSDDFIGALEGIGLNYEQLVKQVDNGTITMPQAISKITTALNNVKDETERAELAQRILGGTYEYVGTFGVDANNKVIDSTKDLVGALDEVNNAYDESYLKAQRELDGEWNKLKTTIGSAVLPILTEVTSVFNDMFQHVSLGVSNLVLNVQTMANQLKAFFQEIGISIMETFVDNPIFEKLFPNMEGRLNEAKRKHEETIRYIQSNEQKLQENQEILDVLYKGSKEKTYEEVKNVADQKTKELADAVDTNTKDATDKAKTNVSTMKSEVEKGLGGLSNIALTETGEIPKATKQNLDNSINTIKNSATGLQNATRIAFTGIYNQAKNQFTNMSNVARTEFTNLSNIIKNQSTNLYSSSRENFINMANVFRTQATNMINIANNQFVSIKNIGSNQFKNLRDNVTAQMISMRNVVSTQWNNIKNTLSKPISGKVTVTRVTQNKTEKANDTTRNIQAFNPVMPTMRNFDINAIDYNSRNYQAHSVTSESSRMATRTNNDTLSAIQQQNELLTQMVSILMSQRTINVDNSITLDGREIARGTAKFMEKEISSLNRRSSRLAGSF